MQMASDTCSLKTAFCPVTCVAPTAMKCPSARDPTTGEALGPDFCMPNGSTCPITLHVAGPT